MKPPDPAPTRRNGVPTWIATSASAVSTGAGGRRLSQIAGQRLHPVAAAIPAGLGLDSAAVRMRMVRRLAASGVQSRLVLEAMSQVERHRFVDSALVNQAYEDTSLPIGLQQTISKPSVVARMIELLLQAPCMTAPTTGTDSSAPPSRLGRVLEIGTGCGYQAAVLAQVAREVFSIERLRGLHEKARHNLHPLQLTHLHLLFGDGTLGHMPAAPYDAIIAAAGGEALPPAWLEQLAVGGRLVAPMSQQQGQQQILLVVDKTPQGFTQSVLEAVHFVPLKSGVA